MSMNYRPQKANHRISTTSDHAYILRQISDQDHLSELRWLREQIQHALATTKEPGRAHLGDITVYGAN